MAWRNRRGRTNTIAAAVEAAGVPHVVLLSSVGAHQSDGTGPVLGLRDAETVFRRAKDTGGIDLDAVLELERLQADELRECSLRRAIRDRSTECTVQRTLAAGDAARFVPHLY